jgi:hypothetical protein
MQIPVVEWSKAKVSGQSLAGIAGLNPARGHGCLCCVCVSYSKDKKAKPGQSGQRNSIDEVQKQRNPAGGMDVCLL